MKSSVKNGKSVCVPPNWSLRKQITGQISGNQNHLKMELTIHSEPKSNSVSLLCNLFFAVNPPKGHQRENSDMVHKKIVDQCPGDLGAGLMLLFPAGWL